MSNSAEPKYLSVSRAIDERIRSGQWSGKLPSIREIARQQGVSVVTASRALQVLRDRGVISLVERSGAFLIEQKSAARETWAVCLRLTPGPTRQPRLARWTRAIAAVAQAEDATLDNGAFDLEAAQSVEHLHEQIDAAKAAGVGGVLYLPARLEEFSKLDELFLDACRWGQLPVVLMERKLVGATVPTAHDVVECGHLTTGERLTRHLFSLGRQRVAVVAAGHEALVAGYLLAHHASGSPHRPAVLVPRQDVAYGESVAEVAGQVIAQDIDGLVCFADSFAYDVIESLVARGASAPRDVGVTGCGDLPSGGLLQVGLTTASHPTEEIVFHALRLLRERARRPMAPPARVEVAVSILIRESCGARGRAAPTA